MTDREGSRFTIYPPYVKTLFMGIKIYKNIPVGSFGIRNELSDQNCLISLLHAS